MQTRMCRLLVANQADVDGVLQQEVEVPVGEGLAGLAAKPPALRFHLKGSDRPQLEVKTGQGADRLRFDLVDH